MRSNYKKLGDFIRPVKERNSNLKVDTLLGVSIQKVLMPSIANTVGTNMKTYKIIKKSQFAYGPVTSRNGDKISIALLEDHEVAIISQAYTVFEVKEKTQLDPEYLMMWFRRPEFDRYARYHSHGSARETFDWEDMCEVELPIPDISVQREIVAEYNTVVNRIKLNEQLNQKLEETAQAVYRRWFVEFEFPCLPQNYRFSGQVNQPSGIEKPKDFNSVMTYKRVGGLPIPDGKSWFVYVLLCEDGSFYKGMTNDLYRRFYEHFTGIGARHTKAHKPVKVIHWEQFDSKTEARDREEDLKTGFGRTWLKREYDKLIKHGTKPGLPAHQTKLVPAGKMVWNEELGKEVPEGWEVSQLAKYLDCNISNYGISYDFDELLYLDTSNLTDNKIDEIKMLRVGTDKVPSRAKRLVTHNDILYSTVRPNLKHFGLIKYPPENMVVSTGFAVLKNKSAVYRSEVLYQTLIDEQVINALQSKAEMSVSTYPSIKPEDLLEIIVALPSESALFLKRINSLLSASYELIYCNNMEVKKLNKMKVLMLSKMTKVETEKEREVV